MRDRAEGDGADTTALVDDLAARLRSRVLEATIPQGAWLRQETLAAEFGVSRTPVREALRKLQSWGVVELVPNRGALVRGPTEREIREAYIVRAELEGLAAELATGELSPEHRRSLHSAAALFHAGVEGMVRGVAGADWSEANTLFHEVILDAANNRRLRSTVLELHQAFPRNLSWSALSGRNDLLKRNVEQHEAILWALEAGDPLASRAAMREHVRAAGEVLAAWHSKRLKEEASQAPAAVP